MTEMKSPNVHAKKNRNDTPRKRKTHIIKVRVTAEEKLRIAYACKELHLTQSELVRRVLYGVNVKHTVVVAQGGEDALAALAALSAQCSKVGSNLNQLARHFNSGGADTEQIRAKHLGDKFDKVAVLATLQANAERKPKAQFKQDTIGKLIDIQSRMTEGKGIGYKRWLTKHNLKVMAQTVKLLQEKGLTDEDALNQRITELETKYHDSLAVVKDLEGRMKFNKELRYHIAAYTSTKNVAQQLKTAKRPAAFEEQHRAELTAYRAAAAYFKANNLTKLPSPKKLEDENAQLASEKAKFYEQYKESKEELLKLKTAKQNVASFFREEEQTQQER